MTNNFQSVINWLMGYPQLKILYFNSSTTEPHNVSLNTITNDDFEVKYIRGRGIKRYDFAIVQMASYDTGTGTTNLEEMFDVQKFMDWIDEQNKLKNYPIFEKGNVISVENLQNAPTFSGVLENGMIAKYMFQIRIRYII